MQIFQFGHNVKARQRNSIPLHVYYVKMGFMLFMLHHFVIFPQNGKSEALLNLKNKQTNKQNLHGFITSVCSLMYFTASSLQKYCHIIPPLHIFFLLIEN